MVPEASQPDSHVSKQSFTAALSLDQEYWQVSSSNRRGAVLRSGKSLSGSGRGWHFFALWRLLHTSTFHTINAFASLTSVCCCPVWWHLLYFWGDSEIHSEFLMTAFFFFFLNHQSDSVKRRSPSFFHSSFAGRRLLNFCRFHPRTSASAASERRADMRVFPLGAPQRDTLEQDPHHGAALMWGTRTRHTSIKTHVRSRGSWCHSFHSIKTCESHFVWSCYGYCMIQSLPEAKESPKCACEDG